MGPASALAEDIAQDVDAIGHDAIHTQVEESPDPCGVVHSPDVNLQAQAVRGPDEGPVDDPDPLVPLGHLGAGPGPRRPAAAPERPGQ